MKRVIIKNISHNIENGKYPAKGILGQQTIVSADIFGDGHDQLDASITLRQLGKRGKSEFSMEFLYNDIWRFHFLPDKIGRYVFQIHGWIDPFLTWKHGISKKIAAGKNVDVDIQIGLQIIEEGFERATEKDQKILKAFINQFGKFPENEPEREKLFAAIDPYRKYFRKKNLITDSEEFTIEVEREKAGFSAWYELFPRSASAQRGKHGTFNDVEELIPQIAKMGFDTIYFPPIHPIGEKNRKGKNNALQAARGDVGSPWAIGSREGGHKSIHKSLGTMKDFAKLVETCRKHNIEIALDIAFQCAPDHPYIKEHPQWFKWRPDGTIQYAENPPKKYEDIVPFDFDTPDWKNLWEELKSIVEYWIDAGVEIFRVDNPHTKSLPFWKWMIEEVRKKNPRIIFLAEAFTRPRVMEQLAMAGFSQSYTYFTWRNEKWEIEEYLRELTQSKLKYYFRPNFWPNTPDILPPYLTAGGENAHLIRLILAATMSSNYGVYGPVYEFGLNTPVNGKEEYIDNEKYELKNWDWNQYTRIKEIMARLNLIRRENKVFHRTDNIQFCETNNANIICYAKMNGNGKSNFIAVVNLDPFNKQEASVRIPYDFIGGNDFRLKDMLSGDKFQWHDEWNSVSINPSDIPAQLLQVEQVFD